MQLTQREMEMSDSRVNQLLQDRICLAFFFPVLSFALPSLLLFFFLRQTLWKPSLLPRGSPCSDKALALGLVR